MKKSSTSIALLGVISTVAIVAAACGSADVKPGTDKAAGTGKKYRIATVVKVDGISWFGRMREGVKRFAEDTGHDAFTVGPAKADGRLQAKIIEELIDQGVDAICVVPFSVTAVEPVLEKARKNKIVVVSHEASNQKNADCIIEAFYNPDWGRHLMDQLAKYLDYHGGYAIIIGSRESRSQMEWSDAAIARQREKYPNLKLVCDRIEDRDNMARAYAKAKALIKKHPDLRGILCFTMPSCPAAALAAETEGVEDRVNIVGASLVSVTKSYLESGSLKMISLWDPGNAGYVMNKIAVKILDGETIRDGMDLGVKGYENIRADSNNLNLFFGKGWVDVVEKNMSDYPF